MRRTLPPVERRRGVELEERLRRAEGLARAVGMLGAGGVRRPGECTASG
jgi:hypothetical protein